MLDIQPSFNEPDKKISYARRAANVLSALVVVSLLRGITGLVLYRVG